MRQVSTDTRVSHHTGYLGMDEDTPKGMCIPKERRIVPQTTGKIPQGEKGTKDNKVIIVITLQEKKIPSVLCKTKMCEGQICIFLKKKKRMLH